MYFVINIIFSAIPHTKSNRLAEEYAAKTVEVGKEMSVPYVDIFASMSKEKVRMYTHSKYLTSLLLNHILDRFICSKNFCIFPYRIGKSFFEMGCTFHDLVQNTLKLSYGQF